MFQDTVFGCLEEGVTGAVSPVSTGRTCKKIRSLDDDTPRIDEP